MAETLETFREEIRDWLAGNYPDALRTPTLPHEYVAGGRKGTFHHPDAKAWLEKMAAKGWTVPTWPKEYGGGGLSEGEAKVLAEEMKLGQYRAPLYGMGPLMIGPTILQYGSEAQKLEHLPKIARGEIRWCQGYSEPDSGSDLASLQMRAEDKGDHYLVTGSKLWTSAADVSDWMFCLVRTDPTVRKHAGISLILFDLGLGGVSVSPI
jgi:acyl-CoA dehydrogenase